MNKPPYDFIELTHEYPLNLSLPEKEDYFLLPVSVAQEMGLKTAVFTIRTKVTPQKREVIKGVDVFRFDSIIPMLRSLVKSQPTLVHGHSFGWMPVTFAPLLAKKYVMTPHMYKLDAYPKWKVNLVMNFLKRSNAFITLTEFEATQFKKVVDESKVKVIPHPIDCDFFFPKNNESKKIPANAGSEEKVILCVSNLFPIKNLETLIRGFARVKKTFPKTKLLIVGGEPKTKIGVLSTEQANWHYQFELLEIASSLGVKEDVIFTGHKGKNELRDLYRAADVFCLPSKRECQSLASGEAASSGLPLVLSDLEPLLEIYQGCALFQKPLDYEKLSDNIIAILESPKLAKTLGSKGRTKMLDYHPMKIRRRMKQLYGSMLNH